MTMPFEFSLRLKEQPITVTDASGTPRNWTIRELTGDQRDIYFNDIISRTNYVDGKPVGFKDIKGMNTKLLSMCLVDENRNNVSPALIALFPHAVIEGMIGIVKKLSGLSDEGAEDAKNE